MFRKRDCPRRPRPPRPPDPWQTLVTQELQANRQVLCLLWALVFLGVLVFSLLWWRSGRP